MSVRAGFLWETRQHFTRFIEDCGIVCEVVTPHMLAAPFYCGSFNCLIIPTGFGNPQYSKLLPALRAASPRIQKFLENGGNLLVYGAAIDNPSAYDWLPFPVTYHHECHPRRVTCTPASIAEAIVEDYDPNRIECDGYFPAHDGEAAGLGEQLAVVIEKQVGKGYVVITSIHEFPSKKFLDRFCRLGTQTLF
jgi:glutamine amidotransferase-like uncharacterized protein